MSQKEFEEKWLEKPLEELIEEKPKSKLKVSDADGYGQYPFSPVETMCLPIVSL